MNNRDLSHQMLLAAIATLLLIPSQTFAQACFTCYAQTDPDAVACVEVSTGGYVECTVNCSQSKCKCTTKSACKLAPEGASAPTPGAIPATKGISAPTLSLDPGGILVYDAIRIELEPSTRTALESVPWMLALYLETANDDGQLHATVTENGLFSDKTRNELYAYKGEVTVLGEGIARINLQLIDHPQIRALRAEVRKAGNTGSVTIVDNSGRTTTQRW